MVQQVKLLAGTQALRIRAGILIQHLVHLGKQQEIPGVQVIRVSPSLGGGSGSWLWPGPALTSAPAWSLNQQLEDWVLSLSAIIPCKQLNLFLKKAFDFFLITNEFAVTFIYIGGLYFFCCETPVYLFIEKDMYTCRKK